MLELLSEGGREGEAERNWACRGRGCINNEAAMHQQPHTFYLISLLHLFLCRPCLSPLNLSISLPLTLSVRFYHCFSPSGFRHPSFFPIPIFNLSLCNAAFLLFKPVIHPFLSLPSISLCLCSCIASLLKHSP